MTFDCFNHFNLYLQFPKFDVMVGTIFTVHFLYHAVSLAGIMLKENIAEWVLSALFFDVPLIQSE